MALPAPPEPVTLVIGMLSSRPELLDRAETLLAERYGPVDLRSPVIDFTWTAYYEPQMGDNLKRRFISFTNRIDPGRLALIKLETNALEADLAREHRFVTRPVNLDPGCVSGSKLVLASAKDRAQRIYLGQGIYAEITLEFRNGGFRPVETTYPDYRSAAYIDFFTRVRERHLGRTPSG